MKELRAKLALYADRDDNVLNIDRAALDDLLKRRMFIAPGFEVSVIWPQRMCARLNSPP